MGSKLPRNKGKVPSLSVVRYAEIYRTMILYRGQYCDDEELRYFKMPDFWQWLCGDGKEGWQVKTFRSDLPDDYLRKAAIIAFDGRMTLTVDEILWEKAKLGSKVPNFILGHEFAHLALDHHLGNATKKNFLLKQRNTDFAIIPPTPEELEANFGGVVFQCGPVLEDVRWGAIDIANRAFSDVAQVEKAMRIVRLEAFKQELNRQLEAELRRRSSLRRIVL
ncbi:MAG: hypothetical protein INF48_10730 [Rhodobacter sp.]|nr:hypothetical protein [Rhodobacter sp.]